MEDTKEYIVAPKLAHHLIGICLTGGIAGACAYMAITNTSGISTRRTNLSPEMFTTILWVLSVAAGLLCLIFLVEMVLTQTRPVAKIRLTPTDISIPMLSAFRRHTVSASYAHITQVTVELIPPNRLLRIHTTAGNATVAELNLGPGVFDELHATLLQRAPHR
ncbi:hypothetical protein INH39_27770 [Massilia violaceinigra]|uniref:DUF304 domain-containing protein n=1 Tax=Massilia violaceinigra TaxID=2045208 RepID=A0ABY4A349_9BURK|nr:hypothetical protein [Massilia violaceinigra]UOD29177.1 hypothetical protein INH39_27770 [Massilia violaceinigra]